MTNLRYNELRPRLYDLSPMERCQTFIEILEEWKQETKEE